MKKLLCVLLVLAVAITAIACSPATSSAPASSAASAASVAAPASSAAASSAAPASSAAASAKAVTTVDAKDFSTNVKPNKQYTIAVVVKSAAIPVWQSHIIAAKKAGTNLGVKILDYAPKTADNINEQKQILENLITTGVDAVILAPANTDAVKGPVTDLLNAKISVIYDNTMGPSDLAYSTYTGIDNKLVGTMIADKMGDLIKGTGNVLVMAGVPGQATSDLRTQAVLDEFKAKYPNIVAETGVTNWLADQGRTVTEAYITKWGDKLKACVSVGGNQGEGAAEAIKAAGLAGKVLVNGFDVQAPQFDAVSKGDEIFTVSQGVYDQAYDSVVAAIVVLNGGTVPQWIKTPITIVTKDNLAQMDERPDALQKK